MIQNVIEKAEAFAPLDKSGAPNIIYVEGVAPDFSERKRIVDNWCDSRFLISYVNGEPVVLHSANATTMPGRQSLINAASRGLAGAAIIMKGFHDSKWVAGFHKSDKYGRSHFALIQARPVWFTRDANMNWIRDDKFRGYGVRGLNQHSTKIGGSATKVGAYSAGCLVGTDWADHRIFMYICAYYEQFGVIPSTTPNDDADVHELLNDIVSKPPSARKYWSTWIV